MTIGQDIDAMLDKLRRQRDELKLQAHLFKAETRDEWEKAEEQWQRLQSRAKRIRTAGDEAGEEIARALRNLGNEMLEGYKKIRKTL